MKKMKALEVNEILLQPQALTMHYPDLPFALPSQGQKWIWCCKTVAPKEDIAYSLVLVESSPTLLEIP